VLAIRTTVPGKHKDKRRQLAGYPGFKFFLWSIPTDSKPATDFTDMAVSTQPSRSQLSALRAYVSNYGPSRHRAIWL